MSTPCKWDGGSLLLLLNCFLFRGRAMQHQTLTQHQKDHGHTSPANHQKPSKTVVFFLAKELCFCMSLPVNTLTYCSWETSRAHWQTHAHQTQTSQQDHQLPTAHLLEQCVFQRRTRGPRRGDRQVLHASVQPFSWGCRVRSKEAASSKLKVQLVAMHKNRSIPSKTVPHRLQPSRLQNLEADVGFNCFGWWDSIDSTVSVVVQSPPVQQKRRGLTRLTNTDRVK